MNADFVSKLLSEHNDCDSCPRPVEVSNYFQELLGILYLDYAEKPLNTKEKIEDALSTSKATLTSLLVRNPANALYGADRLSASFFDRLPAIYTSLNKDIEAIYEGDPASTSKKEIVRSYPGFFAIAAYRIAKALHTLNVEDLPRIITEYAHSKTGIDIHPGATIGDSFCIDHGTGIVIGETAEIHNNVKIYQGVTLGALSVSKSAADTKRHPTIEEHCVIYSGATILGGKTVIGHHSIIGGNVWITKTVKPHSKIYYQATMHKEEGQTDTIVYKEFAR